MQNIMHTHTDTTRLVSSSSSPINQLLHHFFLSQCFHCVLVFSVNAGDTWSKGQCVLLFCFRMCRFRGVIRLFSSPLTQPPPTSKECVLLKRKTIQMIQSAVHLQFDSSSLFGGLSYTQNLILFIIGLLSFSQESINIHQHQLFMEIWAGTLL